MSKLIPPPIHDVAAEFDGLPGIGPRAALRYAYWLVNLPKDRLLRFADALKRLADGVTRCHVCGLWSDASPCTICTDPRRNDKELCVVASPQDVRVIEECGAFKGRYHILGGTLDPVSGRTPEQLYIPALIERLMNHASTITEVILAFDPDVPGDTTVLYLKKQLAERDFGRPIRTTRLARGLPNGATLEYADEMTVAEAMEHRREG
ncbi:recombination mediator RecR [Patescibacteria group bacterium]|nr:recombination mediator RecR [Patescibacteria group bacterium]MDL1953480.1 recombination protein RecR [Candidatus Uhrbacteria bacterium UHB]RIL00470.1 MAG: recombination protein RecR [Candidatus Uhrbacteria bacterium]